MRNPTAVFLLGLLVGLTLTACQSRGERTSGAASTPAASDTSPRVTAPLIGTDWKLRDLEGRPAGLGAGNQPATLLLASDSSASGFAGCNRFRGTYTLHADSLRLGPLMATKMACAQGTELERAYLAALDSARTYRIAGYTLVLIGTRGPLASFEGR
jgi:heat shock protein HslJ